MGVRSLRTAGHLPSLVAALVHFDVSFMAWMLIGALGAYIAADLQLTPAQKGLMVAVPPLGGAVFRVVLGVLADRFGIRRLGLASLGLTSVPLVWAAAGGSTYPQLLGIGLLLGLAGASFAVALPQASRWYPAEHQGLALGIVGTGNSGTLVAALVAPRLAERVGWHAVFALALVPVGLAWVTFAALAREPARAAPPPAHPLRLLRHPDARCLAGFYAVTFGGFVGLSGYLPIFFVDRFGLAKVTAAGYAAICAGMGSLLRPVGGLLADHLDGTRVLGAALATVAGLGALVAAGPGLGPTVVLLMATLGTLGIGNGAVFQLVPQRFPGEVGTITGLVGAVGGLGGFALPLGFGVLKGATGSFGPGFLGLVVAALVTAAAVGRRQRMWSAPWRLEVPA
jgi:NNP family nitrate/nitrite transporter-like MFS transporter